MKASTLLQPGAESPSRAVADPRRPLSRAPARDRDAAEFHALYDQWFDEVARWIRALGGPEADRDDVLQEVFLVVRRRLSAFDGVNVAGWLYRITRRQVRDFQRRAWVKHIFNRHRVDEPDRLADGRGSPAAAFEHKERQRILYALLSKMKEDRRTAFVLFELEGLSGEEIARIQSIPLNTVWTRLHHARRDFFELTARFQRAQGLTWQPADRRAPPEAKAAR
jgi:RNA polymerase sigma-70 factor (ECF subfamily)